MKKILIATTALVLVAGAASADVTIAGSGYFGMGYDKNGSTATQGKTFLIDRMQLDFKATKTTDSGLTFHGAFRVRSNQDKATGFNGGAVGVTAGGLDVSVGNVTDAYDASGVVYNSEIGICGCGGEVITNAAESSSTGSGHNAVLVTYTMGSLIGRVGYQQANGNGVGNGEASIGLEYTMGSLHLAGGYLSGKPSPAVPVAGDYTGAWLAGEYAIGNSHVGVLVGSNHVSGGADNGTIATLYGNTTFGATTVSAFVSNAQRDLPTETTKTTYGIGASYDLGGGAAMVGHVRTDRTKDTLGDLGVTFKF